MKSSARSLTSRQNNSLQDMSFSRSFHPVLPASPYRGKPRKGPVVPGRESKLMNRIIMEPARRATETPGHPPPAKTKARSIFSVVYEARQGYVDYGAAVKIQANWRGCYVRRMLLREITHVANTTAIRFQVQWRRYRIRRMMDSRSMACLKIQAGWRRYIIGRDVIEFSKQMATLNRCTAGCIARLVISRKRTAISVFQKLVAAHICRLHLKKQKFGAAMLQSRIK